MELKLPDIVDSLTKLTQRLGESIAVGTVGAVIVALTLVLHFALGEPLSEWVFFGATCMAIGYSASVVFAVRRHNCESAAGMTYKEALDRLRKLEVEVAELTADPEGDRCQALLDELAEMDADALGEYIISHVNGSDPESAENAGLFELLIRYRCLKGVDIIMFQGGPLEGVRPFAMINYAKLESVEYPDKEKRAEIDREIEHDKIVEDSKKAVAQSLRSSLIR